MEDNRELRIIERGGEWLNIELRFGWRIIKVADIEDTYPDSNRKNQCKFFRNIGYKGHNGFVPKSSYPRSSVFIFVKHYPLQYCRQQNTKTLQDQFYQEDNHLEEANCRVQESYSEEVNIYNVSKFSIMQEFAEL